MSQNQQTQRQIEAILKNELPFENNVQPLNESKRFICDHSDSINSIVKNDFKNVCSYRGNNMWEMELHKKMFHKEIALTEHETNDEDDQRSSFDFKGSLNIKGSKLPSYRQFNDQLLIANIFQKMQSTNSNAKKRQLKLLQKNSAKSQVLIMPQKIQDSQKKDFWQVHKKDQLFETQQPHGGGYVSEKFKSMVKFRQAATKSQQFTTDNLNSQQFVDSHNERRLSVEPPRQQGQHQLLSSNEMFLMVQNLINQHYKVEANPVTQYINQNSDCQIQADGDNKSLLSNLATQNGQGIQTLVKGSFNQLPAQHHADFDTISKMDFLSCHQHAALKSIQRTFIQNAPLQNLNNILEPKNALVQDQENVVCSQARSHCQAHSQLKLDLLDNWINEIEDSSISSVKDDDFEIPTKVKPSTKKSYKRLHQFNSVQTNSATLPISQMQKIDQVLDNMGDKTKPRAVQSSLQLQQYEEYFEMQIQDRKFNSKKTVQCPYQNCDKTFKHRSLMILHARTHTGDKPFKCSFCDQRFITKGNKKDHERRHLNLKLFECAGCKVQFYRSNQLKKHVQTCSVAKTVQRQQSQLKTCGKAQQK